MFGNKMDHVEKAIEKKQVAKIISLCDDKDQEVCIAAIAGLGSIGGNDASNYLVFHLQNPNPKIRLAIAKALEELGDMHTKASIVAQLNKEEDADVRKALSKALTQIRSY